MTTIERKRVKEKAKERFFKLVDKTREKNKNTNPKKIEKIVNKTVEEVRKNKYVLNV